MHKMIFKNFLIKIHKFFNKVLIKVIFKQVVLKIKSLNFFKIN